MIYKRFFCVVNNVFLFLLINYYLAQFFESWQIKHLPTSMHHRIISKMNVFLHQIIIRFIFFYTMKLIAYTRNLLFLHHNDSMFNKSIIYINLLPFKNATTKLLSYKSSKRNRDSLNLNICLYTLNLVYSFLHINKKRKYGI